MDTRFLKSFTVAVELGSIAAAARALHLTPAAVSQRVQALEAEIGAKLLQRAGRTVTATPAGAAIMARAAAVLADIETMKSGALLEEIAGELRLGAVATAMTGLLPDLLRRCSTAFPRLDIHVAPGTSRELYPRVLDGSLDAALIVQPDFPLPKACLWRALREEPLVAIAPAGTPMRSIAALLENHPFIRYGRDNWGGRQADAYLRQHGLRPRQRFELDSLDAIAVMVDRGLGVSLVPDWAPPWPAGLSLAKAVIADPAFARHVGLISLRASARSHLVAAFAG